jgi:L-amino acid N-acyltransferase YncA
METSDDALGRARAAAGGVVIRPARAADDAQIAAIWNREAIGTAATTDTRPRDADAQRAWLAAHTDDYPALVAAVGDEVVAFGGLAPYCGKPSYTRTAEDSVYVKDGWRGKGLGGLILDALVECARARGHHSMIARVTAENGPSLRLHERHGFVRVGHEREVAFKLGRWLDVLTLQRLL